MRFKYFCLPKMTYDNKQAMMTPVKNFYKKEGRTSELDRKLGELVQALALCHNVTPFLSKKTNKMEFEAASPDEKTLVEIAQELNVELIARDDKLVKIRVPGD